MSVLNAGMVVSPPLGVNQMMVWSVITPRGLTVQYGLPLRFRSNSRCLPISWLSVRLEHYNGGHQ